jgi:hypothetical protein
LRRESVHHVTGTESQIQWAERIKPSVQAEFDRVANAFRRTAERQQGLDRADTLAIIAILEEKRVETFANEQAGYFVRVWQDLSDQVRQLPCSCENPFKMKRDGAFFLLSMIASYAKHWTAPAYAHAVPPASSCNGDLAPVRQFAFEGLEEDRVRPQFTVRADLSLIRAYGIHIQDLPVLCRDLLERCDVGTGASALTFTEENMRLHQVDRLAAQSAHKRRTTSRRPLAANTGNGWRTTPLPMQSGA